MCAAIGWFISWKLDWTVGSSDCHRSTRNAGPVLCVVYTAVDENRVISMYWTVKQEIVWYYSSVFTKYGRQLNRKRKKKYSNREDKRAHTYQTQKRRLMLGNKHCLQNATSRRNSGTLSPWGRGVADPKTSSFPVYYISCEIW